MKVSLAIVLVGAALFIFGVAMFNRWLGVAAAGAWFVAFGLMRNDGKPKS